MADDLLNSVILLENQIQQQLKHEQARAAAWLDGVRAEQKERERRALHELSQEGERLLSAADERAAVEGRALVAAEKRARQCLEMISEPLLLEVLDRQLLRLLPGQVDDHKDVQS